MSDFVLSLVMLASAVLIGAAIMRHRRGDKARAMLMGILALVMLFNVVIWIMPTEGGDSLAETTAAPE